MIVFKTCRVICLLALIGFMTACIRPYQPAVQQGNILNNSNLSEIRYGMSKQEVLFILGTPLVADPFLKSRWDYYYSSNDRMKKETKTRIVTAHFEGDALVRLDGDVQLESLETLEPSTEDKQHGGTVITEPTHKDKGILTRLFKRGKK